MTKSRRTASTSPSQRITAAIIEKLEQGTKPWVNQSPEHRPGRLVINFFDWPESKAANYPLAYEKILRDVKPDRQVRKDNGDFKLRKPLPQRWWQYAEKRPALYHAIGRGQLYDTHPTGWKSDSGKLERVIVFATGATKYPCFTLVPNEYICAHTRFTISEVARSQILKRLALLNKERHEAEASKTTTLKTVKSKQSSGPDDAGDLFARRERAE